MFQINSDLLQNKFSLFFIQLLYKVTKNAGKIEEHNTAHLPTLPIRGQTSIAATTTATTTTL